MTAVSRCSSPLGPSTRVSRARRASSDVSSADWPLQAVMTISVSVRSVRANMRVVVSGGDDGEAHVAKPVLAAAGHAPPVSLCAPHTHHERLVDLRTPPMPAPSELGESLFARERRAVAPRCRQRVEHVSDANYLGTERDFVTAQTVRVPTAIDFLMVPADD